MKKILLSLAFVTMGIVAFAQKPAAGDKTVESQFGLNMGGPNGWTTPEIRVRYFLDPTMAVRGRLVINYNSATTHPNDSADITTSSFGFTLGAGVEKHFAGTEKLSPYAGAELYYSFAGASNIDATNSNNGTGYTAQGDTYKTTGGATNGFGLKAVFGADYYFTNSIYLGGEMGWGFGMTSTGDKTRSIHVATGTSPADVTNKGNSSTTIGMMNFPTAAVRFGIKF